LPKKLLLGDAAAFPASPAPTALTNYSGNWNGEMFCTLGSYTYQHE